MVYLNRIVILLVGTLLLFSYYIETVKAQTVIDTIPVGDDPHGLGVNSTTNLIYVANISRTIVIVNGIGTRVSSDVSVIDGTTNQVVATVPVEVNPFGIGVNSTTNLIYVANMDSDNISVIDGATNQVIATVPAGDRPWGISVNPTTNLIYVVDSSTSISANIGNGDINVIDGTTNQVVATVPVGDDPLGVGVNHITNLIYVANSSINVANGDVSVIDGATNQVIATVPVGNRPQEIDVNPTTNLIYVANDGSNTISVIDGATNQVIATVPVGGSPLSISVNPTTNLIYTSIRGSGNVSPNISVIDGTTNQVVATVPVEVLPFGIGVNSTTNLIYVAHGDSDSVSVIEGLLASLTPTATPTPIIIVPTPTPMPALVVPPIAQFSANPTSGAVPLKVNFTDQSIGEISEWLWSFGDGNQNIFKNPSHTYSSEGFYGVSLTVTGPGGVDTETKASFIIVATTPTPSPTPSPIPPVPEPDFDADPVLGIAPLEVKFTDKSKGNPTSWIWEFGDGGITSNQNPIYVYNNAGMYSVSLTAANSNGKGTVKKDNVIEVREGETIKADFIVDKSTGFVPFNVKFTDKSKGNPRSWIWEFGDGGITSNQNPEHEYLVAGLYTVGLTVSQQGGASASEIKTNFINVVENTPVADFMASVTAGQSPLNVKFTDLSQPVGNINSWVWDFSDGATKTGQDPEHTYNIEGFYNVSLTVSNPAGADSEIKTNLITVKGQNVPVADFISNRTVGQAPFSVDFFDQSEPVNNIASWIWNFGDGSASGEQHPSHEYTKEGIFTITQTVSNSFGADSEVKTNLISVIGTKDGVLAGFSSTNNVGVAPFNVQFINNSGGDIKESTWQFGDNITSSEREPIHIYKDTGEFDVSLSIKGVTSADTTKKDKFIKIITKEDVAAWFTASPLTGNGPLKIQLVDRSVGDTDSWLWDFGDGNTSTEQNPEHVYIEKGKFTVSVAVKGKSGTSDVKKREEFIEVLDIVDVTATPEPNATPEHEDKTAPEVDFIVDKTSGTAPLNVDFSDKSENEPDEWLWEFGDGAASEEQNPSHEYPDAGIFSVTLTVSNDFGEDSIIKDDLINVKDSGGDDKGKSFTFKCRQHSLVVGDKGIFEKMNLDLGENEECTVTLTNLEPGVPIEFSTYLRSGRSTSIQVSPENGVTDANGQMEFTISAIEEGSDWIAWAVRNDKGEFEFSKKAYDDGTAWGMFVEVK